MKSKLLFFVLLSMPGCLAYIEVRPVGTLKRCPYSLDELQKRVILDGLKGYIEKNDMATAACFYQIEEDYETALDVFVINMTDTTCKVGTKYSDYENLHSNFPFLVSKAIKDMGKEIKTLVKYMKQEFRQGQFKKVISYNTAINKSVEEGYGLYQTNLEHLVKKAPDVGTDVQNIIHVSCSPGMRMLEAVDKEFEKCMKDRLAETEKYLQSLNNKKD